MSINKVILLGNVGKDPEVRQLENGKLVATFSLATTEKGYTLANGTNVPERTEWHNVVIWGNLAKVVQQYVKKGSKLYLEGKIRTRSYEKDGSTKYITEVFAEQMEMLGDKPQQLNPQVQQYQQVQQNPQAQQYQQAQQQSALPWDNSPF